MKVISMADKSNKATHYSPEQALMDVLSYVKDEESTWSECNKLLIVGLDTTNERYDVDWRNAGIKGSEVLALCDALKARILKEMGY